MPDWSYHTIFKPILHRLQPSFSREFIHRGMSMIASSSFGEKIIELLGQMAPSPQLEKSLFGVSFASPIGLSGKIDPQLSGLAAFQNLGFGFVEIGPVSVSGSLLTEEHYVDPKQERIDGNDVFPIKLLKVKNQLQALKKKKMPFFIRVEGTFQEMVQICLELHPFSDGYIMDYRTFESANQYTLLQDKIRKPIIIACTAESILDIEKIVNFYPCGILLDECNTAQEMIDAVAAIRNKFGDELPIITSGGIKEPADALTLLDKGVSLIMLSFEYVFTGPGLPKRINEAYCTRFLRESAPSPGWLWYWMVGLAITIAGLIALFFSMTVIILPYDEVFLGVIRSEIHKFNPAIIYFMAHDRMTLSGTMISGGIIFMQMAWHGVRKGLVWARKAINYAGIIGFLGIFLFIGYGYFDWLHALFWLILLPLFFLGYSKSKETKGAPISSNLFNHRYWKWSLIGQLSFVLLGFALTFGGLVISVIGASSVFVPTDLSFLCITQEMLNEFNDRLIPVIAHDRAGFGSALLSVGLLVLMLALWGIREGDSWVWWTFFLGAIPAFLSGLLTHFTIGYTDFVHLLPAYIAVILYINGVIWTAPFLLKKGRNITQTFPYKNEI
ncbi:dihydroorotate dehydrogenase [Neobacillus sp. LXY-1]|uniref:dihydroorotate dehydrogenase n=1 Tax=Neobacillus sp. LXY-1 TaxID=3379133 RepID=UPI003EE199A5